MLGDGPVNREAVFEAQGCDTTHDITDKTHSVPGVLTSRIKFLNIRLYNRETHHIGCVLSAKEMEGRLEQASQSS